jgi:hypothetical protein
MTQELRFLSRGKAQRMNNKQYTTKKFRFEKIPLIMQSQILFAWCNQVQDKRKYKRGQSHTPIRRDAIARIDYTCENGEKDGSNDDSCHNQYFCNAFHPKAHS